MLSQFKARFKGIVRYDAENDKYSYIVYERQFKGLIIEGIAIASFVTTLCYAAANKPLGESVRLILFLIMLVSGVLAIALPLTEWSLLQPFKELKVFDSQEEASSYIDRKYLEVSTNERFF